MKIALACIAKNEDLYIDEWIKYYFKLGFDDILIYTNDWEFTYNHSNVHIIPVNGKNIQIPVYNSCYNNFKSQYEWIAFFDVDEFLVLKKHKNIHDFLSEYQNYPGIGINWVLFGDNHLSGNEIHDYSVISRFTKRCKDVNQHIKTIVNTSFNHSFNNPHGPTCNIIDSNFRTFTPPLNIYGDINICQINHYFCKTKEEFKVKVEKGRADIDEFRNISEFDDYNHNEIDDFGSYNFFFNP